MKGYGDSGKGNQFSSAKRGSQQTSPYPSAHDNPPGIPPNKSRAGYSGEESYNAPLRKVPGVATRERIRDGGGSASASGGKAATGSAYGSADSACICPTYGRGANDGSKPSPRKKVW
jgi:hypothetical protein